MLFIGTGRQLTDMDSYVQTSPECAVCVCLCNGAQCVQWVPNTKVPKCTWIKAKHITYIHLSTWMHFNGEQKKNVQPQQHNRNACMHLEFYYVILWQMKRLEFVWWHRMWFRALLHVRAENFALEIPFFSFLFISIYHCIDNSWSILWTQSTHTHTYQQQHTSYLLLVVFCCCWVDLCAREDRNNAKIYVFQFHITPRVTIIKP